VTPSSALGEEVLWGWDDLGERVSCLAWSPDGSMLAAGSLGGDVRVYAAGGERIDAPVANHFGVLCLGWSGDGARLAVGGQDGTATVWEAEHRRITHLAHRDWVNAVAWSPEAVGSALAVAAGMDVALYRPDGVLVADFPFQPGTVDALAWAGRPSRLAAGSRGGVRWLAFADGPGVDTTSPVRAAVALAPHPGGRVLAAGDLSGSVHLWDLDGGEHIELRGYPGAVELVAWDGIGAGLAAVAGDDITVWLVARSHEELAVSSQPLVLQGHDAHVADIAFHPGGTMLASAGADGVLASWDPATTTQPLRRLAVGRELSRCAWRPGGDAVAVPTADGVVGVIHGGLAGDQR
jgi:WD40 repeat protein